MCSWACVSKRASAALAHSGERHHSCFDPCLELLLWGAVRSAAACLGTWPCIAALEPCRSAARRLGAAGLLPMLLDDAPQPLPPASPDHREVVDAGALPHTVAPACAAEPVHTLADEQVPTPASAAGDLSAAPARQNCSTKSLGAAFAAVVHTGELGGAQHAAVAAISTLSSNQHQHPPMPAADVCTRVSNAAPGVTMPSLVAGTATMTASVGQRPPVSNSPVEHVSTIELEAALHRAAAELRAAEAAAMAAADDQDMPDFEGEDAADDAAERVEGSVTEAENKCADGSVQALAVELAGEEGVEELLQEMEEAQKLQPSATDEPASTGQPAASCDNALPLWHTAKHRLSTYTFSSRLELYVEQATWERLDRFAWQFGPCNPSLPMWYVAQTADWL